MLTPAPTTAPSPIVMRLVLDDARMNDGLGEASALGLRRLGEAEPQRGAPDGDHEPGLGGVPRDPAEVTQDRPVVDDGADLSAARLDDEAEDVVGGRRLVAGLEDVEHVPRVPARPQDRDLRRRHALRFRWARRLDRLNPRQYTAPSSIELDRDRIPG